LKKVKSVVDDAQGHRSWTNPHVHSQLKDLVDKLLKFSPKDRLGANSWSEIKEHPFFKADGFDWHQLETKNMKSPLLPMLADKIELEDAIPCEFKGAQEDLTDEMFPDTIESWSSY
jgi:hypothetical protein